ncbi:radical SAM protein, partial [bacterium]|nr:radical SAM protein [bacterium]
ARSPDWRSRRPIVVWNVTKKCNLGCLHCYAGSEDKDYQDELTTQEGETLINDLSKFGAPVILFSGGEPLLRKDLFLLAELAVSLGMRAVISSNGTLVTKETAKKIKETGFSYVGVSLDGSQEINDYFRNRKGAHQKTLRGIRLLKEAGVKVGLRFTLSRHNFNDLTYILDLLEKEDIPRLCIYHLVYSGRAGIKDDLAPDQRKEAISLIYEKTRRLGRRKEILTVDNYTDGAFLYLKLKEEDPDKAKEVYSLLKANGGNSSGIGIGCIDHRGNVHPDQFWTSYSLGNVRERSFSEIWMDTSDKVLSGLKERKGLLKGRCGRCVFLEICNGNMRIRALAAHQDLWAPDPACYLSDEEIGIA